MSRPIKTADLYNLHGGIDSRYSFNEIQRKGIVFWEDGENVVLDGEIIKKTNGCENILTTVLSGETIVHIGTYTYNGEDNIMIITDAGKMYLYDKGLQTLSLKHSGFTVSGQVHVSNSQEKYVVCTNTSDVFYYDKSNDSITQTNLYSQKNKYGSIAAYFAGRLFVASENGLYWSALGDMTDWTTDQDAGYAETLLDPITALIPAQDYLAVFTYNSVHLFTGFDHTTFQMLKLGDEGITSKYNVCKFNNNIYFYANGLRSIKAFGDLAQLNISSDLSLPIARLLEVLDRNRLDEIRLVTYEDKKQVWIYIPDKAESELKLCIIADFQHDRGIAFYKRRGKGITALTSADGLVYSATVSNALYREDWGDTFDGDTIEATWKTTWLTWGEGSQLKTAKSIILWHDAQVYNKYNLAITYDSNITSPVNYPIDAAKKYAVWDSSLWDESYWAGENTKFKLIKGNLRRFNSMQLTITTSNASDNFALYGFSLENLRLINAI